MAKTVVVSFRMAPETKAALERLATKEGRTLAGYMRRVLDRLAQRKGK